MDRKYIILHWIVFLAIQQTVEAQTCGATSSGLVNCTKINTLEEFKDGMKVWNSRTKELLIQDSEMDYLIPELFKDLKNIKTIRFFRNNIRKLPSRLFDKLNELEEITISNGRITDVQNQAFAGLSKLKTLNITGNNIYNSNYYTFDNITSLVTLNFGGNGHPIADEFNAFMSKSKGLSSLTSLLLHKNDIQELEDNSFGALNKLETLNLGENSISYISDEAFAGLSSLKVLNLSTNGIKTVLYLVMPFQHTPNLEILYLDNNNIETLGRSIFKDLKKLTALYLQRNKITTILPGAFDDLKTWKSLSKLYLFGNQAELPENIFDDFDSLNELLFDGTNLLIRNCQIFKNNSNEVVLSLYC